MVKWTEQSSFPAQIKLVWESDEAYLAAGLPQSAATLFDGAYLSVFQNFNENGITVFVGLGKPEKLDGRKIKNVVAKGAKHLSSLKVQEFCIDVSALTETHGEKVYFDIVAGTELGLYSYAGIHQENKEKDFIASILDCHTEKAKQSQLIETAHHVAQGMILTREWINTPGNYLTPELFAKDIESKLQAVGCAVSVLDHHEIAQLEMNTFLAVGNSSDNRPRLIVIKYMGNPNSKEIYGFVGKGVTVDTGGYSLKSAQGLMYTKGDMGGAAAVAGAMYGIAQNKLNVNVVAVIPACENRLSNQSHIPGDVVKSMNGKTIEILNTDAEGRLILADALTYAVRKEKVTHLVDVATLTGAVAAAFGSVAAGCMTNDHDYLNDFLSAAQLAGEKYWELPTYEEYEEMLKSKVADLKNAGGPTCGSIAAGLFLREFVEETPWIHLDIAGTSQTESPTNEYHCFGGTGAATSALYYLAHLNQDK